MFDEHCDEDYCDGFAEQECVVCDEQFCKEHATEDTTPCPDSDTGSHLLRKIERD